MATSDYERLIIDAWYALACTRGRPSPRDRTMPGGLHAAGTPLPLVLAALAPCYGRRSPDLAPIRSLACFQPIEVTLRVGIGT